MRELTLLHHTFLRECISIRGFIGLSSLPFFRRNQTFWHGQLPTLIPHPASQPKDGNLDFRQESGMVALHELVENIEVDFPIGEDPSSPGTANLPA